MDCHHPRSYGPSSVFFWASCSRRSEGLLGQSFSIAPTIQALRGFPCLWSFSVVQHIRHIEGLPWLGSYSVDWCVRQLKGHPGWGSYSVVQHVRCLMGQPVYCSAADAGMSGEREAMMMAPPPMCDSAVLPCFHGCLAFLYGHFPPQSLLSHPLICLSIVNRSHCSWIAPQSLNSSSQLLCLPGALHPVWGMYGIQQGRSDSHYI